MKPDKFLRVRAHPGLTLTPHLLPLSHSKWSNVMLLIPSTTKFRKFCSSETPLLLLSERRGTSSLCSWLLVLQFMIWEALWLLPCCIEVPCVVGLLHMVDPELLWFIMVSGFCGTWCPGIEIETIIIEAYISNTARTNQNWMMLYLLVAQHLKQQHWYSGPLSLHIFGCADFPNIMCWCPYSVVQNKHATFI